MLAPPRNGDRKAIRNMNKEEKVLQGFYLSIEYFRRKAIKEPKTREEDQLKTAGIIHARARAEIIEPQEFTYRITLLWDDIKALGAYANEKAGL